MSIIERAQHSTDREILVSFEHLLRRHLALVKDVPVIDTSVGNKTKGILVDELPEHDIFIHRR